MKPEDFASHLIVTASRFVGLQETKSNAQWDNPRTKAIEKELSQLLSTNMRRISGWAPGAAYCIAGVGAVVLVTLEDLGYSKSIQDKFTKVWSASVMNTVEMAKQRQCLSTKPVRGSIWLARNGSTWRGHAGIVAEPASSSMATIEFNTSAGPTASDEAQRNGDGIFNRVRNLKTNGSLVTQGFISPVAIMRLVGVAVD